MRTLKRRLLLVLAGAAIAVAAAGPAPALGATELHVCTWLTQPVGDAVGTISAAPGSVLGPNNGGQPGGGAGPFPIFFTTGESLVLNVSSSSGGCS